MYPFIQNRYTSCSLSHHRNRHPLSLASTRSFSENLSIYYTFMCALRVYLVGFLLPPPSPLTLPLSMFRAMMMACCNGQRQDPSLENRRSHRVELCLLILPRNQALSAVTSSRHHALIFSAAFPRSLAHAPKIPMIWPPCDDTYPRR